MRTRPKRVPANADISPASPNAAEYAVEDVADRIYGTLAAAISEGALTPGTKILEEAIAEHFGVSRTVVRGALGVLQRDHLLERKRNHGMFVAEPSIEDAKELFEARRVMERTVIEMAVQRAEASDLDQLETMAREEKHIHAGIDEPRKTSLSGHFHLELAKVSRNGVLTELLGKIIARLSLVMALYEEERRDECGADQHLAIVDAIRRRNTEEAQQLMNEHLADIEGRVRLMPALGDRNSFVSVLATFSRQ